MAAQMIADAQQITYGRLKIIKMCLFFECCLVYLSYPLSERKRNKNERKQIAQINKNMGLKKRYSQMYLVKTAFSAK